ISATMRPAISRYLTKSGIWNLNCVATARLILLSPGGVRRGRARACSILQSIQGRRAGSRGSVAEQLAVAAQAGSAVEDGLHDGRNGDGQDQTGAAPED